MKKIAVTILCVSFVISSFSQERKELRKNSPNRMILQLGGGVFSNFSYDWDPTLETFIDNPEFRMSNVTYSGMLGYRSGFNRDNYRFSSTGRDRNWGNVLAIFYQSGTLDGVALSGLGKDDIKIFIDNVDQTVRFTELQIGGVWKETFRISGGRGSVKALEAISIEDIEDLTQKENIDYNLFTAGFSWRFGRFSPTFNWTIMSADNFETTMSRFDIQICMNLYFWKKILYKDKHLIKD